MPLRPVIVAAATIFAAVSAIGASYRALEDHGLPKFKTAITADKEDEGARWMLTILAAGLAFTAVQQVFAGGFMMLYTRLKALGAMRCFIMAACAHVCQTAAVAGPKRLASETYRLLNLTVAVDSAARLYSAVAPTGLPGVTAIPAGIALFSSAGGWLVGKLYKPD
mmetsp:Transcript_76305/g.192862  ORF Transcript_76305/g.192862 Transcript_76305/m.192862 type:complete len:166 (-) Transcript_76305:75-572(-)